MSNDRKSPAFWDNENREYVKVADDVDRDYREFCRRFRVDKSLSAGASADAAPARFGEMTQFRARMTRADLMFRCPRPIVAPPAYERGVFTPTLARVRTLLLQDFVQEADYYREFRRCGLNLALGYRGVVKVGCDQDGKLGPRELRRERQRADDEFLAYVQGPAQGPGSRPPRIRKGDSHLTHVVQHAQVIAAAERGELPLPDEAIDVMKAHVADHSRMLVRRETESHRYGRVWIRNVDLALYSHDPWATRPYDREWHAEDFTERMEEAGDNPEYDKRAVAELAPVKVRRSRRDGAAAEGRDSKDSIQTLDLRFRCREVIDLVEMRVVRYQPGGTRPLSVKDYVQGRILPSGPYEEFSLVEDPEESWGVCPPKAGEDSQEAVSELMDVATETVRRGVPMQFFNAANIDEDILLAIQNGTVAQMIPVRGLPPGADMSKMIAQVAPAEISQQNFAVIGDHRNVSAQQSGLGGTREQAQVQSKTATEALIMGNASSALADDSGGGCDDFQARILAKVARLQGGCYTQRQVVDIVGEIALRPGGWPAQGLADDDVRNDRGVSVVPGSSQRNSSAVVTAAIKEMTTSFQASPLAMVMPKTLAELYERWARSLGQYGLGFDQVGEVATLEQQMAEQAAMAQAQAGGDPNAEPGVSEGAPGAGPTGGAGAAPRPAEAAGGATPAGQGGGMMNRAGGGGRVPTGAGVGDNPRIDR